MRGVGEGEGGWHACLSHLFFNVLISFLSIFHGSSKL